MPILEAAMWTPEDRALVGDFGSGQALSDDQYRLIEPFIPPPKPGGRPRTTDMRRMLDGLFYVVRTGCQWRHLPPPPAFPPWQTVYGYFRAFLEAGVWETIRHYLVTTLRETEGREVSPTAVIIDAADIQDADSAWDLLKKIKHLYCWLQVVFADSIYNRLPVLLACFLLGLTLIIVRRIAGTTGFVVIPRRWIVERTLGWFGRWRRLSKDYEELPEVSEAMASLAAIRIMLQRLVHPNRKRLPPS